MTLELSEAFLRGEENKAEQNKHAGASTTPGRIATSRRLAQQLEGKSKTKPASSTT
jgi:hypothetical protein